VNEACRTGWRQPGDLDRKACSSPTLLSAVAAGFSALGSDINLQPKANLRLTESFEAAERPDNIAELPQGEQVLAGVKFTIGKPKQSLPMAPLAGDLAMPYLHSWA